MVRSETWPPAIIAKIAENYLFSQNNECKFDQTKENQIILLPGMGASVSQLFRLVNSLRAEADFQSYGITAIQLGLSLGTFKETLSNLETILESKIFSNTAKRHIVLYGHSHGGRFACQLATKFQKNHPGLSLKVITGGTPIVLRPSSCKNWLFSLAFKEWPSIVQPQIKDYYSLYSRSDEIVNANQATRGSKATLIELQNFSHNDFIDPEKICPILKELCIK